MSLERLIAGAINLFRRNMDKKTGGANPLPPVAASPDLKSWRIAC
jgi:hypothetical protein